MQEEGERGAGGESGSRRERDALAAHSSPREAVSFHVSSRERQLRLVSSPVSCCLLVRVPATTMTNGEP